MRSDGIQNQHRGLTRAALMTAAICVVLSSACPADASQMPQVSAGNWQSCAVQSDGTPVCWGGLAIFGDGVAPAIAGGVTRVAAGFGHTCAIRTRGDVTCWGSNEDGTLDVPAGFGTVTRISAGLHTCAVKFDATVGCWAYNAWGQSTPPADLGPVAEIALGAYDSCAVKLDRTVACWGYDNWGNASPPKDLGTVTQISAGQYHTCAVTTEGSARCWGDDQWGQRTVPAGIGTVLQIAAGSHHSCAIKQDHTVRCWGDNAYGQTNIPAGLGHVSEITAGQDHNCALRPNGTIACWGRNDNGQSTVPADKFPSLSGAVVNHGDGSGLDFGRIAAGDLGLQLPIAVTSRPMIDAQIPLTVKSAALSDDAGGAFKIASEGCTSKPIDAADSCTIRVVFAPKDTQRGFLSGALVVTDDSVVGTHLIPLTGIATAPAPVRDQMPQAAAGALHSCAVRVDSTVACWGNDDWGQARVPAGLTSVASVSLGPNRSCALRMNGAAACWGQNIYGESTIPADLGPLTQISPGIFFTCGIKANGAAACWGYNADGQTTLPADLGPATQISAGGLHACAVKTTHSVSCWGYDQLGQSTVPRGLGPVRQVSAGYSHTCAVKTDQSVSCWGSNAEGESTVPSNLGPVSEVSAGTNFTCALRTNGAIACWGRSGAGQLAAPATLRAVSLHSGEGHSCATATSGAVVCWGDDSAGESTPPAGLASSLAEAIVDGGDSDGMDFGELTAGNRSALGRATITSRSSVNLLVTLNVKSVALSSNGDGAFTLASETCTQSALDVGKSCTVRARFSPRIWQRGNVTGAIRVLDDSARGTNLIPLSGTALAPTRFIAQSLTAAVAPSNVAFAWEASDSSKVTIVVSQKSTKQTLVTNANTPAGARSFSWNRKIGTRAAAKGTWTVALTSSSSRGKLTLTKTFTLS